METTVSPTDRPWRRHCSSTHRRLTWHSAASVDSAPPSSPRRNCRPTNAVAASYLQSIFGNGARAAAKQGAVRHNQPRTSWHAAGMAHGIQKMARC